MLTGLVIGGVSCGHTVQSGIHRHCHNGHMPTVL